MESLSNSDFINLIDKLCNLKISKNYEKEVDEKLMKFLESLSENCIMVKIDKGEDVPCTEADLEDIFSKSLPYLKYTQRLTEELAKNSQCLSYLQSITLRGFLLNSLLICMCYSESDDDDWFDTACSTLSNKILADILMIMDCNSSLDFFCGEDKIKELFPHAFPKGYLNELLVKFSERFTKNTWKKYPLLIKCYRWILFKIKVKYFFVLLKFFSY